jgi:NAD(P)-dependent dehydrogenase (short-subunit alcohol dehydrogenase family)
MQATLVGKSVLVTGANRGLGEALVQESLRRGAARVNLYGTLDGTRAFLPLLTRSHGAVVNIVSLGAVPAVPVLPAYSVSKAASLSLTQSLRALLTGRGVSVYAVLPDPMSAPLAERWGTSPVKDMERQNAALVSEPVAA